MLGNNVVTIPAIFAVEPIELVSNLKPKLGSKSSFKILSFFD